MNKLLQIAILSCVSLAANATLIDHFNNFSGGYVLSGDIYTSNADLLSNVAGIGTITEIQDTLGNILWSSGLLDSYVNFVFSNFHITSIGAPDFVSGASNYTESNGVVSFYQSAANIFSATGNVAADVNNITSNGIEFAKLVGSSHVVGGVPFSIYGTMSTTNVDGHGALDIVGGSNGANFDTNSIRWKGILSDMSFDFSGTNVNTSGYVYGGTVSAKGLIVPVVELIPTPVPEPVSIFLLGIGLLAFAFITHKPGKVHYIAATA